MRFCDAFNIPLITLLLPGLHTGAPAGRGSAADGARSLANLLFAFAEASVPKLTILAVDDGECRMAAQVRHDSALVLVGACMQCRIDLSFAR